MALIQRFSSQWQLLIKQIKLSHIRTNTDYLCLECWKVFPQNKIKKHKQERPDHNDRILSSKYFASESKFTGIAIAMGKRVKQGKLQFFESPYPDTKLAEGNNSLV